MPRLRTDDGPRKLRAVWLGPAGHTLPFQWTYVQWAVTLIAVPIAGTIGTTIVYLLLGDPVWAFGLGGLWFGAGGVYLAIHLMRYVTFDEPLSYQRRMVKGEFSRQFSQPVGARRITVEFEQPSIDYLAAPIRRAMGWDVSAQQPLAVTSPRIRAGATSANPYLTLPPNPPMIVTEKTKPTQTSSYSSASDAPPATRPNPYTTSART
ncbi:MAG TPA: hypothetical protein VFU98_15285 [Microlunatus sp.]|nr:hypothetical protein [Microlunatus sp.]